MQLVLTSAGEAALAGPAIPALYAFKLGDGHNYTPNTFDNGIHGTQVFTGIPSNAVVVTPNLLRYTIVIDPTSGPFDFGEIGLYLAGDVLFALGAFSTMQHKEPDSNTVVGGYLKIDCFVSVVGNSYAVLADVTNAVGNVRLPVLPSIDQLPQPVGAAYNTYVCLTNVDTYVTTLATAEGSFWSFTGYESVRATATVSSSSTSFVSTATNLGSVTYQGEIILQFVTGALRGISRNVTSITLSGTRCVFGTPLTTLPANGDTFILYQRQVLSPALTALLAGLSGTLSSADLNQLDNIVLNTLLNKDGSIAMTGNLNVNGNKVVNLANPVNPNDGANKAYIDAQTSALTSGLQLNTDDTTYLSSNAILKNGTRAMQAPFNLGGYRAVNASDPTLPTDLVNLRTMTTAVSNLAALVQSIHNNLSGLQGGSSIMSQWYHVTQDEHDMLAGLAVSGFPISSTTGSGLIEIADTTEIDVATSNAHAISPNGFISSLSQAIPPTNMMKALMKGHRLPLVQASVTTSTISHPAVGSDIPWEYVWLDADAQFGYAVLGAKSAFTTFTVPLDGYYQFTITVYYGANGGGTIGGSGWLIRNQTTSTSSPVFAECFVTVGEADSTNGSIIVKCTAGDVMSVRCSAFSNTPPDLRAGTLVNAYWIRPI